MKIVILHLSDIHFKVIKNPIADAYHKIGNAVRSIDSDVTAIKIIVTGDIANTGNSLEYAEAKKFFMSLESHLKDVNNYSMVSWVFVPGNHDCDFSKPSELRNTLLETQVKKSAPTIDEEIIETLLKPQKSYINFVADFLDDKHTESDICRITNIDVHKKVIRTYGYNTAISSSDPEVQGELFFPVSKLVQNNDFPDIAISCFHHPYGWLESNNARELRKFIESTSDLILTGHEHESGYYNKLDIANDTNMYYLEGAVLQDHNDDRNSGFNSIVLDVNNKVIKNFKFKLKNNSYETDNLNPEWQEFKKNKYCSQNDFEINQSFNTRFLTDSGAGFTNSRKGKLNFSDIFVPGHLDEISRLDENKDLVMPPVSMSGFVKNTENKNRILIIGEEQSGKTSFAKYLFLSYHQADLVPVIIRAGILKEKDLNDVRLRQIIIDAFSDQYSPGLTSKYLQLSNDKRVLLVDDLHLSPYNKNGIGKFIKIAGQICQKIVMFSHALSFIDEVETAAENNYLTGFSQFEVKEFGNQLREALIERWYLVGNEYTLDEIELEKMVVKTKISLDQILGKNLLPSYPIFILIILQQLEASTNINTSNGAHGYLYELLITSALTGANAKIDLDTSYTFLGMLAESMFKRQIRYVSEEELIEIFKEFCEFSKQTIRLEKIEKPLLEANILIEHDGKYWFRYKYCYYYFAARFLSDRLRVEFGQTRLRLLGSEIYREEYGNILMFLAYLSNKDQSIIDTMLDNAREIYKKVPECDFTEHVAFVTRMHIALPKSILLDQKSNSARAEINKRLDNMEHTNNVINKENTDINDALSLNVALKTIQVLGQLLKNFPSSLDGKIKLQIAEECYKLGLRTLTKFVQFAEKNREGITALFEEWLGKMASKETEMSLKPKAEQFIAFLVEAFSTVVIRRVSTAVGVASLAPLYEEIRKKYSGLPINIIDYSVKLDHFEKFPSSELDEIIKDAKSNIFPVIILRRLTIEHFQRFPVERATKQSACKKLNIELKHMQLLENKQRKS